MCVGTNCLAHIGLPCLLWAAGVLAREGREEGCDNAELGMGLLVQIRDAIVAPRSTGSFFYKLGSEGLWLEGCLHIA